MGLTLSRALARLLGYQKEVRIVMVSENLLGRVAQHLPVTPALPGEASAAPTVCCCQPQQFVLVLMPRLPCYPCYSSAWMLLARPLCCTS